MKLVAGSLLLLALSFAVADADRRPRRPPQAAFDACARSKAGDACSVALGDRTIQGVCAALPDTQELVCRPDRPPGPPPAAIEACNGRSAGDACTISHGDHTLAGTCERGPDGGGPLACRPDGPPPQRP